MNTTAPTPNSKLTTDSKLYTLNSKLNTHLHQTIILSKHPPILRDKHRGINRIPFEPLNDSLREIHPRFITEQEIHRQNGDSIDGLTGRNSMKENPSPPCERDEAEDLCKIYVRFAS